MDEPRFSRFFENFLSYIKTHEYCLDFFSYHAYGNSIQKLKNRVAYINETLQKTGIGRVPLLCTEYNSLWEFEGVWDLLAENDPYAQQEIFESMRSATAAAYILAAMITFQEIGVEIANFYRTDLPTGWDSLFNVYGVPQKPYYAALAFSYVGGREQVLSETPTNDLYAIAAKGDGENVILLSNYEARSREYMLQIDGLEDGEYELCEYLTDDTKNHELVRREIYTPRNLPKYIYIRSNSLRTLVLTKTPVKTGASRIDKSAPKEYN